MKKNSALILGVFTLLLLINCKNSGEQKKVVKSQQKEELAVKPQEVKQNSPSEFAGNYVSDKYGSRSEGYDWVGVKVIGLTKDQLEIKVRSRADKKRPTCTFDSKIYRKEDNIFTGTVDGKSFLVKFEDETLSIEPEKTGDEAALYFYCSGGATIAGTYERIEGELDPEQVDQTVFTKNLRLQDVGFNISTVEKNGMTELTFTPYGLSATNEPFVSEFKGEVTNAEIEDLNSDGCPEVLVYTMNENNEGGVRGYSCNNGKSMSQIYFPDISDNPELIEGYDGFDEFTIVETSLARRFPVFNSGERTGKMRQVVYKLEDGENSRKFVVKTVTEF